MISRVREDTVVMKFTQMAGWKRYKNRPKHRPDSILMAPFQGKIERMETIGFLFMGFSYMKHGLNVMKFYMSIWFSWNIDKFYMFNFNMKQLIQPMIKFYISIPVIIYHLVI